MSHFLTLVIGANVEAQLAPYNEFECSGLENSFVQEVDVTEECREHGLDWHGLAESTVMDEADVVTEGRHRFGYAVVDEEGDLIKAVKRTNPDGYWDYWYIGGRWSHFLVLKAHAQQHSCTTSAALKRDIDFDGMREAAAKRAAAQYDKVVHAKQAAGYTAEASWATWAEIDEKYCKRGLRETHERYHSQPVLIAVKNALNDPFDDFDQYLLPRTQFIQEARDRVCSPYAIVMNGQWLAKGKIGWFGLSGGEMSQADWNRKVNEVLDSLPDDTLITVVDCHI